MSNPKLNDKQTETTDQKCPKCGAGAVIKAIWLDEWVESGVQAAWACGSYISKDNHFIRGGLGDSSCYARELANVTAERDAAIARAEAKIESETEVNK